MKRGLGIYIHWPYCLSKCPYCDFNSFVKPSFDADDIELFKQSYLKEIAVLYKETPFHFVKSIYFGGGTPSLMPPALVGSIIESIKAMWPFDANIEITLEANPGSVNNSVLKEFYENGVNRLSIGVQALSDEALQTLGRLHSKEDALRTVEQAAAIFPRLSFDLIYARPNQTVKEWEDELNQSIPYAKGHLSLYSLTIEDGTPFFTRFQKGKLILPNELVSEKLYDTTVDILNENQYVQYEISNFAQKGHESEHNLIYWRYQDYIGIGPGAHGRFMKDNQKWVTENYANPYKWLEEVRIKKQAFKVKEPLSTFERVQEMVLMGLRLEEGIPLNRFIEEGGATYCNFLNKHFMDIFEQKGWLLIEDEVLKLTSSGKKRLNAILGKLF